MAKTQLNIKIDRAQVQNLDKLAAELGLNRSEVARLALSNIKLVSRPSIASEIKISAPKAKQRRASA